MKRSVLQLVLQGCNHDLVQAIEQILSNHASTPVSDVQALSAAHAMAARSLLGSSGGSTLTASGLKSAFSPITSVPSAMTSSSALRYPYPPNAARGLFAMPGYPPAALLPNLGYSYSAMAAAAAAAAAGAKPGTGNPYIGLYPGHPYPQNPPDK